MTKLPILSQMSTFAFYWKDGRHDIVEGANAVDALLNAGYNVHDIRDLDFFTRADHKEFEWKNETGIWEWSCKANRQH
jgi:hypothetical protein